MQSTRQRAATRDPRGTLGRAAQAAFVPLAAWLAYVFLLKRPSNERSWEYGMETLADITITGQSVHIQHVRDFEWGPDGPRSSEYVDRTFDVDRIARVWFVEEPFTIGPLTAFKGVAHTYFAFDFENQSPVAVSVEARRERGETFDGLRGLLNQFELIYIWGTERDLTGSRAVREKNQLYMFPLNIPLEAAKQLFRDLAEVTRQLGVKPRFYNTLMSNCTNELAKAANMVQPGAIPPNIGLVLPGYSDEVLYKRGFLPNNVPLEQLRQRVYISEFVKANYERADFSTRLRSYLNAH
jgi:hypothetical protein